MTTEIHTPTEYTTAYYRSQVEARESIARIQDARMDTVRSHRDAREAIETAEACRKPTAAMRAILKHAERHDMTYQGAEQELISTGRLQAMLNDR